MELQNLLNCHDLSEDDFSKKELIIKEGQDAETAICQYIDSILTTVNPCNSDNSHWVKPATHPCKKKIEDISKSEWDKDYEDLVNLVQRHSQCSSAYCLRKKGEDENLSCHFNYPKDLSEKTHLQFEEIRSKDGTLHYRVKVNTKCNDTRINNHQRTQLQGWRANCDMQVIIDYHSCLEYIAKYASKCEKLSSVAKEAFTSVVSQTNSDNKMAIKKLMMRAIGQRDMGIQEVMHQILSIKLLSSSFQVVTASLNGSRNIKVQNGQLQTDPSILDLYAKRNQFENDFPGVSELNFVQFVSTF